jgi:hypothetical protein
LKISADLAAVRTEKNTALLTEIDRLNRNHSGGPRSSLPHRTSTEIDHTQPKPLWRVTLEPARPHFNRNRPHFNRNISALQQKSARTSTEQFPHFNRKATALQLKFSSSFANVIKGLRSNEVGLTAVLNTFRRTYTLLNNNILWVVVVVPFGFMQNAKDSAAAPRGKS